MSFDVGPSNVNLYMISCKASSKIQVLVNQWDGVTYQASGSRHLQCVHSMSHHRVKYMRSQNIEQEVLMSKNRRVLQQEPHRQPPRRCLEGTLLINLEPYGCKFSQTFHNKYRYISQRQTRNLLEALSEKMLAEQCPTQPAKSFKEAFRTGSGIATIIQVLHSHGPSAHLPRM